MALSLFRRRRAGSEAPRDPPAANASLQAVPHFRTFDDSGPAPGTLLYGGLLSVAAFLVVSWAGSAEHRPSTGGLRVSLRPGGGAPAPALYNSPGSDLGPAPSKAEPVSAREPMSGGARRAGELSSASSTGRLTANPPPEALLAPYAGRYVLEGSRESIEIRLHRDALWVTLPGEPPKALVAVIGAGFVVRGEERTRVEFLREPGGGYRLILFDGEWRRAARRVGT